MATFTISLVVGAQTFTYTESPSDANAARIGPAYKTLLHLDPDATNQQVWNALGRGVANSIKTNVLAQERADADAAIVIAPFP